MREDKEKIKGIRGWLLFLLIIFILSLILVLFQIFQILLMPAYTDLVGSAFALMKTIIIPQPPLFLKIIHLTFLGILGILLALAIIEILRKKELGKKLSIIAIWFSFLTAVVEKIIYWLMIPQYQEFMKSLYGASVSSEFIKISIQSQLVLSLIVSLTWSFAISLYFLRSKRVKNTLRG